MRSFLRALLTSYVGSLLELFWLCQEHCYFAPRTLRRWTMTQA